MYSTVKEITVQLNNSEIIAFKELNEGRGRRVVRRLIVFINQISFMVRVFMKAVVRKRYF